MDNLRGSIIIFGLLLISFCPLTTLAAVSDDLEKQIEQVKVLLAHPQVNRAFAYVDKKRDEILREWSRITEINAPSGKERERAGYVEKLLSPGATCRGGTHRFRISRSADHANRLEQF